MRDADIAGWHVADAEAAARAWYQEETCSLDQLLACRRKAFRNAPSGALFGAPVLCPITLIVIGVIGWAICIFCG